MDTFVFLAVLSAAAMHAAWNAFIKASGDPLVTLAQMGLAALALTVPLPSVWAMTRAPIAQIAALRETSVLFAALIGIVLLGERANPAHILAAPIIVAAIVLLRFG
jgi:drug/metabolite transporter (DMT)-like permease